jgi:hypothetical protein
MQEVGKSAVLRVVNLLAPNPKFWINVTPATLFRTIKDRNPTLLLDEGDNLSIQKQILAVLNNGYEMNGTVPRYDPAEGAVVEWPVFAPVAIAGIGKNLLPSTLKSRCVVIFMHHFDPNRPRLPRFDMTNAELRVKMFGIKDIIETWAKSVKLNLDPIMPSGFKDRLANNWRILFAIADSLDRGDIARKAAVEFGVDSPHIYQKLFIDMRKIFDDKGPVISSRDMEKQLLDLDHAEHDWSRYRGNQPITQNIMADILSQFSISTKQMWLPEGTHRSLQKKYRVYEREDFEEMWRRYTPLQQTPRSGTTVQEFKLRTRKTKKMVK